MPGTCKDGSMRTAGLEEPLQECQVGSEKPQEAVGRASGHHKDESCWRAI